MGSKCRVLLNVAVGAVVLASAPAAATAKTAPTASIGMSMGHDPSGSARRVRITYENLTPSQTFSPSVFMSHDGEAPPLFTMGTPASFGMMRIAEEGNAGPLLSAVVVKNEGGHFGTAATGISVLPGGGRSVDIDVTREHPMLSGAWMLVMTNDGFTGFTGVDAYRLTRPTTMNLYAYDAGTERNNERKEYLVAMMGTERDPEGGVVTRHTGIRGDADAPVAWKFDPSRPVARVTLTPIGSGGMGSPRR